MAKFKEVRFINGTYAVLFCEEDHFYGLCASHPSSLPFKYSNTTPKPVLRLAKHLKQSDGYSTSKEAWAAIEHYLERVAAREKEMHPLRFATTIKEVEIL